MREFNDVHSKTVFMVFKNCLQPMINNLCPGWDVKNMVVNRKRSFNVDDDEGGFFITEVFYG
jgi:hypothetical protein